MAQEIGQEQLPGAIEALLFVTDEPVGVLTLAEMLKADVRTVENALICLRERFEQENRGIQLREVAGGWRLFTHPAYHELIEKYVLSWDTRRLSQAAMETLAIIAYTQPTTRAGVASVRGVNSDSSINSLVEKGLVREAGVADTPGNPVLYATTRAFLEKFGLRSPADLPDLAEFAPDDTTRALIRERLSVMREDAPAVRSVAADSTSMGVDAGPMGASVDASGDVAAAGADGADDNTLGSIGASTVSGNTASEEGVGKVEGATNSLDAQEAASDAAQDMLADAMAQAFGLVDKIDFDSLTFETDDE
ncbi:SMC-Scp complex subunit ScpB [Adlercreutzia sp. ZJ141]|uniref:SMC-Scp complex subunit ScpB n=1 Tax=Adlercreutzia sp. ZJ141 TaxID=2709406 RepID=UPI001F1542B0|nr:SMC-Scp complex subunit ScpB [Adlercreutzia sp. ZJ141]